MSAPNQKLAASLTLLRRLQRRRRRVFRSGELPRVHRDRLVKNGFLRKVIKGWLISSGTQADLGDTTPWFAAFHEFCAAYCTARFGKQWHLCPQQSLLLHAENTAIQQQTIIHTPKGANKSIQLLFNTSIFDLRKKTMPPKSDLTHWQSMQLLVPEAALLLVPESFFVHHPIEARTVLSAIRDTTGVLRRLLAGGHSVVAGRLAGAFRHVGRGDVTDDIISAMKHAGYDVRESDPFAPQQNLSAPRHAQSPN